jgi:DNA-directed RNA polymerase subunit RPC12/RpoP
MRAGLKINEVENLCDARLEGYGDEDSCLEDYEDSCLEDYEDPSDRMDVPDDGPDSPYAQWRTDCPSCGHDVLIVESVILCATGERHNPRSVLQADGFEVNCGEELKDQSTSDEEIKCEGCGKRFDLSALALA